MYWSDGVMNGEVKIDVLKSGIMHIRQKKIKRDDVQ